MLTWWCVRKRDLVAGEHVQVVGCTTAAPRLILALVAPLNATLSRVGRDGFVLDAFVLFIFHPRLRDNAFLTPRQGWGSEIRPRQDFLIACS